MVAIGESWVSDELRDVMAVLTGQQAAGVLRIVQAELEGRTLSSLLDCPGQICTSTTYYGSGSRPGWRGKSEFRRAVELARRDYRSWMLEQGATEALTILAGTAPAAARALRQQIVGDEASVSILTDILLQPDTPEDTVRYVARNLGTLGLPSVVTALRQKLATISGKGEEKDKTRQVIIDALSMIAGLRDGDRRLAAIGVLDRADVKTAAKQALSVNENELDTAIKLELARLAGASEDADAGEAASDPDAGAGEIANQPAGLDAPAPKTIGTQ